MNFFQKRKFAWVRVNTLFYTPCTVIEIGIKMVMVSYVERLLTQAKKTGHAVKKEN